MTVIVIDAALDPDIAKRVSCRECGARLQYVPKDVEEIIAKPSLWVKFADTYYYIKCPNCGEQTRVR